MTSVRYFNKVFGFGADSVGANYPDSMIKGVISYRAHAHRLNRSLRQGVLRYDQMNIV